MRILCHFVAASLLLFGSPAKADEAADFAQLRALDMRLAGIAYRLTTANAALCDRLSPNAGMTIHALGQYGPRLRDSARRVFGFETPVAVEGVIADGPAARAGVAAGDSLVAVGGMPLNVQAGGEASSVARDEAAAAIDAQPTGQALQLELVRSGVRRSVSIGAIPACRSGFEVTLGTGMQAQADGEIVQIGAGYFERYADEDVAVVVAHELAHNILHHRERLTAAGVKTGLAKEFGRNRRLIRVVEDQADALSVYLLYNAGYDPARAVAFWTRERGDVVGELLRSRTHASAKARAAAVAAEIARIRAGAPRPIRPDILSTRSLALER